MNINDEYNVNIEKMLNEGAGLARISGVPVFVDNACPGDSLKIKIKKINKNHLIGEISEIITQSKYRIKPECPLSNVCGSCNWQYIDYGEQLKQKQNIVFETIKNITGIEFDVKETIPSPIVSQYRHKIQLPVSQTKVSKRFLTGYYKKKSHELVNIKYCPMQPNIVNDIVEFIKNEAQGLTAYNEKTHNGILRHIIFRISSENKQILIIFVVNSNHSDKCLVDLSKKLTDRYPEITGICVNYNSQKSNVILGNSTKIIIGNDFYTDNLDGIKYKISAESFFQVNPYCAINVFNLVKKLITERISEPTILDAYAGVSSFGIWLSSIAKKVVSVEEVKTASNDALCNKKLNNVSNIDIINGDAAKIFEELIKNGTKFDVSLIDPPRKGCSPSAINYLAELTSEYIVYVSCNPATLARDLKVLINKGFKPLYIQPADMFPNTYHVETIVLLSR